MFLLAALILPFFALQAQMSTSDTIGSGTTTSIHSPFCVLTLPMLEDFEGYPGDFSSIPTCWTKITQEYNQAYDSYYPVINSGSMSDPNQSVMFIQMDTYSSYLILPVLDSTLSMQDVSMSFQFKSAQQNITRMVVGVMSDPADTLTFVPVDTVWRKGSTNSWETKEINFATYTDTV